MFCDFCGRARVDWVYLADPPPTHHRQQTAWLAGPWAVCDECYGHIQRDEWNRLVARIVLLTPLYASAVPPNLVRRSASQLVERFRLLQGGVARSLRQTG